MRGRRIGRHGGAAAGEPPPPARPPARLARLRERILVKTSAAAVLARTLFPAKLAGSSLVIGTATDPYQPAERRFQLTRRILEALRAGGGAQLGIITKSPLVLRDLDMLQELSTRHEVTVNISIASVDAVARRRLEPRRRRPRPGSGRSGAHRRRRLRRES